MNCVYGIHAVDSLLRRNPQSVELLSLQSGRRDKRIAALEQLARDQGVPVQWQPRAELDGLVRGRHQGAVAHLQGDATGASNQWGEAELLHRVDAGGGPLLLLLLDGVTDPHNFGACLRSAEAAGADAVVVPKDNSAGLTPVVRKVACGAAEVVPIATVTNMSRTLRALKARGVWLFGAAGEAEKSLYDSDLTGSVALVLGSEGKGLRRLTRTHCDYLLSLPMAGTVSSLNVSVAAPCHPHPIPVDFAPSKFARSPRAADSPCCTAFA
jgi:23S rRNA (guanosine2251-2'-O)-methyltransferase